MTAFTVQVHPARLRAAIADTVAAMPRFGHFGATDVEDAAAMQTLCHALNAHGVLGASRPVDGLDLSVQLAPSDNPADGSYALDEFQVILEQPGNAEVLPMVDTGATALLDLVDPRRQAGPETAVRLIVKQLAVVLREVVNSAAPKFTQALSV